MAPPSITYRRGEAIPGTQYRFVRKIGEGGHGEVYEVEHGFLESRAVMKLLHAHHVARQQLTQRMTREAKTLAKLRHPNIVEVSDGGLTQEEPSRPYFVMEALNGMPVRELLGYVRGGAGALPSIRILTGVLEALEHAHRAGVIHRDVKPDNIFLHRTTADVTIPKVLDFGIAHLLEGRRFTGKHFVGTPRYAAPEQLRGETPSAATDIYAAGLVLYELLTGEPPFAEQKEIGPLIEAHMHGQLPPPSTKGKNVPRELDAIVARFTAKAVGDRPASAFACVVMLREIATRLEASESGVIFGDDFKTAQTPMENMMAGVQPAGASVVREHAHVSSRETPDGATPRVADDATPRLRDAPTRPEAAAQNTVPLLDGLPGGTIRMPAALGYDPTSPSDELPTPPRRPSSPPPDAVARPSRPPGVDRHAATNTVLPDFGPRVPKVDTVVEPSLSPSPAVAKVVTPVTAPYVTPSPAVPSYLAAPTPTPTDLKREPPAWTPLKVFAAASMAVITVTSLAVPLWMRHQEQSRSVATPASTPARAPVSTSASVSPAARAPMPEPTPAAALATASAPSSATAPAPSVAPRSVTTSRPAASASAKAPAKPKPSTPSGPIDPSSVGFD